VCFAAQDGHHFDEMKIQAARQAMIGTRPCALMAWRTNSELRSDNVQNGASPNL
jgi:hypothetical protein